MAAGALPSPKQSAEILSALFTFADDPYGFVMAAFPWGKKGGPLEYQKGPRKWQKEELLKIKDHLAKSRVLVSQGKMPPIYKLAIASGRGIGKSAFIAWILLWHMSCHIGATSIVTANSEDQLTTKTWAELGTWLSRAINGSWFDKSSRNLVVLPWMLKIMKDMTDIGDYYYTHAQLWSEEKPDSFAGAHNPKGMLVVFDEASGIPAPIWTVASGFYTEVSMYRFFICLSNPRRNTGAFFECFNGEASYQWNTRNIDSRTVEGMDHSELHAIIAKFGEDSDTARIEVKGEFPRRGDNQFIPNDLVAAATAREVEDDSWAPLIMGVDVARFGTDATVVRFRQGRNARIIPPIEMRGKDNMEVTNTVAALIQKYNPDAVNIDSGAGTGVIDRLREIGYKKINEIIFGFTPNDKQWADKRTEMWAEMRDFLATGAIDDDKQLKADLINPQYKFVQNGDRIRLESKDEMRKREGCKSPDHGDALALTFAVKVARRDLNMLKSRRQLNPIAKGVDYDIFGS